MKGRKQRRRVHESQTNSKNFTASLPTGKVKNGEINFRKRMESQGGGEVYISTAGEGSPRGRKN